MTVKKFIMLQKCFFMFYTKNLLKTVFNIDSDKIFIANQYNRMIFKGSCDTED